jgi:hypothetical protein
VSPSLSERDDVILPDFRGYGESDKLDLPPADACRAEIFAIDMVDLLDRLDIPSVIVEAGRASFQRTQGLLEGPLLGVNEVRDRTIFRHGTDDFRTLFVSEQIVGVIALIRLRWSRLLNGRHDVTSQGQRT